MDNINIRFRKLREALEKSQEDMGKLLGITKSGISDIERGKRNVTEKHIKLLCMNPIKGQFLNEDWLRTGTGDMFLKLGRKDELLLWATTVMSNESENFRDKFINALLELDVNDWELLANMAETLVKQKKD